MIAHACRQGVRTLFLWYVSQTSSSVHETSDCTAVVGAGSCCSATGAVGRSNVMVGLPNPINKLSVIPPYHAVSCSYHVVLYEATIDLGEKFEPLLSIIFGI